MEASRGSKQANLEEHNKDLRKSLLTFVVVGGGFNGVETVGAINDFVRESIKDYYKNIYMTEVKVILVYTGDKLLHIPSTRNTKPEPRISSFNGFFETSNFL